MTQVPLSIIFKYPLFHEGQFCFPTFWVMNLIPEDYDVEVTPIACIINPLVMWLRGPIRLSRLFVFFKSLCDNDAMEEFFPTDDFRHYFLFVTKSANAMFLPLNLVVNDYGDYEFDLNDGKQYSHTSPTKTTKSETIIKVKDISCIIAHLIPSQLKIGLDHLIINGAQTPINLFRILSHKYDFSKIMRFPDEILTQSVKKYLPERTMSFSDYLSSKSTKKEKINLDEVLAKKLGEIKDKKTSFLERKHYDGPHPDNFTTDSLDQQGKCIGEYCQWRRQNMNVDQDDPQLVGVLYWQRYGKLCNVRVFCIFRHITGKCYDTWAFYRDLIILKQDPTTILIMRQLNNHIRTTDTNTKEEELLNQIDLIISNEIHLPQTNLLQGLESANEHAQTLTQQYYDIKYNLHNLMPIYSIPKYHHPIDYYPLPIDVAQKIAFVTLPMFDINK